MATVDVFNIDRQKVSQTDISDTVFDAVVKERLFYDVIRMQMANRRLGTASTKTRGEIRGGGKKPWRQKGTGRARSGTLRSPLWRGGGIVFGPKPRDYSFKVHKKVKKQALRSALSMKRKQERLFILDKIEMQEAKTKNFVRMLQALDTHSALIIDKENPNLQLSARNVPQVKVLSPEGLNLYDLLYYEDLFITQVCLEEISRRLLI